MSMLRTGLHSTILLTGLSLGGLALETLALGILAVAPVQAAPSPGQPETFDAATRNELQGIITKQLSAFGRDDATTAESFASPQLRDKYPDPTVFFDMVKQNYAPLFKPRSTHFEETSDSPHGPLQKMTVVATDGTVWTVVYAFQRVDGEWRISGCGMMKQESQDI